MSNALPIDLTCSLLQQTYGLLRSDEKSTTHIKLDEVYSNALIKFLGKQEVLWAASFSGANHSEGNSISGHLRSRIEQMAQQNVDQLSEIHSKIHNICQVTYLKGACWMIENDFRSIPWRSMADIDFLIDRQDLPAILDGLSALGYRSEVPKYKESLHAHYPMLIKDGHKTGVEVHTRCFRWPVDDLLGPLELNKNSIAIQTSLGPARIPHANDRVVHLIAHAQIASNRYGRREFLLRDALEFCLLATNENVDLHLIGERFAQAGYQDHFISFVLFCDKVMNSTWSQSQLPQKKHLHWVDKTWSGLTNPQILKPYHRLDVAKNIAASAVKPQRWKAILQTLTDPNEFTDLLKRLKKAA